MKTLRCKIIGIAPLLMHNGQLADPLNPVARKIKEISSKRKKVDADFEEMAKLEWFGSLYSKDGRIVIPATNLEAMLIGKGSSARKVKMGKQAAAAVFVTDDAPLEYDGPTDLEKLYEDKRFVYRVAVVVNGNRVLRTRPMFEELGASFEIAFDPELLNQEHIERWVRVAGEQVGLMEWRPRWGRFRIESLGE